MKLMLRTLYSPVHRCRNPDHPDLKTIDMIQAWVVTHAVIPIVAMLLIILMLFWDYGNFKVVCLSKETVDFPSCLLESLFLHWIETISLFFREGNSEQNIMDEALNFIWLIIVAVFVLFSAHSTSIAYLSILGEGSLLCCASWWFLPFKGFYGGVFPHLS